MSKKTPFSQLNNKVQTEICTIPWSAPLTKNPDDETYDQIVIMQENFLKLFEGEKNKLVSHETSKIIQEIGRNFNLQLLQMADIARAVRGYYFSEIKLEDFPNILAREIPTGINTAQKISEQVIQRIIRDETIGVSKSLINLSLLQAIKQYSQLGEQLITSSPIRLKIFPQSVRPSIKNWIEDYRSTMGAQKHGMMERGNYLFHSENTRMLASGDRKKLAEVLRSLDEDVVLKVDPDRQEIVFQQEESHSSVRQEDKISNSPNYLISNNSPTGEPNSQIQKSNIQIPNKFQNSNNQVQNLFHPSDQSRNIPNTNMRFSSPQTLPSEKPNQVNYQPRNISQNNAGRPWMPQEEKREPTVRGNVVDLKN